MNSTRVWSAEHDASDDLLLKEPGRTEHVDHSREALIHENLGVSPKWAALRPRTPAQLSDLELLLQKQVQAEFIFSEGARDQGGRETIEAGSSVFSGLEGLLLAPTPDGLPDPVAQHALLHPLGSQHSTLGAPSQKCAR